jgi:aldehyde dehydrogenase (NAD+)
VVGYNTLDEAITLNNQVPQGLSSCIFTTDIREAEYFLSAQAAIAVLLMSTLARVAPKLAGAFGGEKETGGGRESGSDSWRNYMRRATNTVNYSSHLPLAQGIKFDL